jgi:hypothetical protein
MFFGKTTDRFTPAFPVSEDGISSRSNDNWRGAVDKFGWDAIG